MWLIPQHRGGRQSASRRQGERTSYWDVETPQILLLHLQHCTFL